MHLSCLHLLAIEKNTAMNRGVQICSLFPAFNSFGCTQEMELLGHMIILCLIFRETAILFSIVSVLFDLLSGKAQVF